MRYEWLVAIPAALFVAQSGCKMKPQPEAAPSASASVAAAAPVAPLPSAAPSAAASEAASAAPPAPELGNVKRFPHEEKVVSGAVRVLQDDTKVYDEPDDKTPNVALLSKDVMVFRLATYGDDWLLVEFPSGVGTVAPGWVATKALDVKVNTKVQREAVAKQTKTATVVAPLGSAAAATASAALAGTPAPAATAKTTAATTTTKAAATTTKTTTAATTAKTGTATTAKH